MIVSAFYVIDRNYVSKQWGHNNAEKQIPFNIDFSRSVFVVPTAQANKRYSHATIGVSSSDVQLSGFYAYASALSSDMITTIHYTDAFYWISIGL